MMSSLNASSTHGCPLNASSTHDCPKHQKSCKEKDDTPQMPFKWEEAAAGDLILMTGDKFRKGTI